MRNLPVVTKNILLINFLIWLLDAGLRTRGIHISNLLGLVNPTVIGFHWWQPLTYMFLHANFWHVFFNMFSVLIFAPSLERYWGSRRFLVYYLVCGLGAAAVQIAVWALTMPGTPSITIGASGAVFGILLAFGWLFPTIKMFLLFIPIPIPARWMVGIMAVVELICGLADFRWDNVAHFAHLGGMLFGALLILLWKKSDWHFPHLNRDKDDEDRNRFDDYHYQRPL